VSPSRIGVQGYLDAQNILSGLGKRNRQRLEAACQEIVNRGEGAVAGSDKPGVVDNLGQYSHN